jgi:hypothetical protein
VRTNGRKITPKIMMIIKEESGTEKVEHVLEREEEDAIFCLVKHGICPHKFAQV